MASSPCDGGGNFDCGLEIKTRSVEQTLIPLVSQPHSRGFVIIVPLEAETTRLTTFAILLHHQICARSLPVPIFIA
ncbi:alpha-catulin isoform X1 [Tachysurus ichikawai]